jgi:lipoate-protein ligase B
VPPRPLAVADLGLVPYGAALERQRQLAEQRIAGTIATDLLLLCEHPPVITLGRGTRATSLPIAPQALRQRGIEVFEIERGGDVTYHGPGQLVGYPIFDLGRHRRDLHWFLREIEAALILALSRFGIPGERRESYTGVWTGGGSGGGTRKIASIGIHVKQWVTWHGFALNVTTDLRAFSLIVPCGIPDVVMTSIAAELDSAGRRHAGGPEELGRLAREAVVDAFVRTFAFSGAETVQLVGSEERSASGARLG